MKKKQVSVTVLFVILCLCYMVPNYAQYLISPLGPEIIRQYEMELTQLSSLFSSPMIPAIFLSLAAGVLLDRYSSGNVIALAMIVTSIGCVGRLVAGGYVLLFLCTMLTGLSAAFINAGCGKIISGWYRPEQVSAHMGILMGASTAAMAIANLTGALFPSTAAAFAASAVFSVLMTLLWILFVRGTAGTPVDKAEQESDAPGIRTCLAVVMKKSGVWCIALALFFLMAANVVLSTFIPMALGSRGISAASAGTVAACFSAGNFVGCFLGPAMTQRWNSIRKPLLLLSVIGAVGAVCAWQMPILILQAAVMLLVGICFGGMIPTLMSIPVLLPGVGPVYAGTAGGVIGTIQLLGAVLLPSYVLVPIAGENFGLLFALAGGCLLAAGGLSAAVRDVK